MRKKVLLGMAVSAMFAIANYANASEQETETIRMAVLDFGHDYARGVDNPEFAGGWKPKRCKLIKGVEVDNNPKTKDCIYTSYFSLEKQFNAQDVFWNDSFPCANFYGGYTFAAANRNKISPTEYYVNIGEGEVHNKPNDNLALHMMTYDPKGPFTGHGTWIWKKEDFLDSASNKGNRIWFDDKSVLALYSARYYGGWEGRRIVVADQGQLYVSETLEEAWEGESKTAMYLLHPTQAKWAKWNPKEWSVDFSFKAKDAKFSNHDFQDIDMIGWYIYKDTLDVATVRLKWESFECFANVTRPKMPSALMTMTEITESANPAFYMANTELPYRVWQDVFRWAIDGQYALAPEPYTFERDGDMGSMDDGMKEHGADEPVTDLRIYDTLAWCNALSEREGRELCYYTDAEFKNPYRFVRYSPLFVRTKELNKKPKIYVKWSSDGFRLPTMSEWLEAKNKDSSVEIKKTNGTSPVDLMSTGITGMNANVRELIWSWGNEMPAEPETLLVLGESYRATTTLDAYKGAPDIGIRILRREAGLPAPKLNLPQAKEAVSLPKSGQRQIVTETQENLVECVRIPSGEFKRPKGKRIQMDSFMMAKTETSYRQWKTIYDWAVTHGYEFDRDGDMGSMDWKDKHFTHSPDEPVTGISAYDAFTWSNALSEYEGRTPVYYADHKLSKVLRIANKWRPTHMRRFEQKNKAHEKRGMKFKSAARFDGVENKELAPGRAVWMRWDVNGYRLPTKAEAFYVASAGSKKAFPWGDSFKQVEDYAWYFGNAGERTHKVGTKKANAYGIHDIYGNALEYFTDSGGSNTRGYGGRKQYLIQTKNPVALQPWQKGFTAHLDTMMVGFIHEKEAKFRVDDQATDRQIGRLNMGVPYGDLGFRVVRCEEKVTLNIDGKKHEVTGSLKEQIRKLKGKKITVEGDVVGDTIRVKKIIEQGGE